MGGDLFCGRLEFFDAGEHEGGGGVVLAQEVGVSVGRGDAKAEEEAEQAAAHRALSVEKKKSQWSCSAGWRAGTYR